MSTYSSSLRIELPSDGTQAGTWGDTTNSNLAYILDTSVAGYQTVSVTAANQALTFTNGPTSTAASNQAVYAMLRFTTTTGAAFAVYAPPASKAYIVWNNSGQSMTIYNSSVIGNTTAAGTGVTVTNNSKVMVWSDATNFYELQAANLTGTLAIANGGTGQVTANAALNALLPSQTSNANKYLQTDGTNTSWDAVSLSTADITGTLAVTNGGTGATTASGARTNLGLVIGTDVLSPSGSAASLTSFPTLNQNTTGTASNVTGTVAVVNGGTGATTASGARTNLGLVIGTDVLAPNGSAASLTSFPTLNQNTTGNATTATTATTANAVAAGAVGVAGLATAAIPIGASQTWSAPSRALDTTYTNSTGRPIQVLISLNNSSSSTFFYFYIDSLIASAQGRNGSLNNSASISAIIPNGSTYKVDTVVGGSGFTISTWVELS